MRLSDHLLAAADGFDEQAALARRNQNPEVAAQSDRLAAHMRRLAGNHQCAVVWDGDAAADPRQLGETAALVVPNQPQTVRDIRRALGLSQAAFAERINTAAPGAHVTKQAVSRWETSGHAPSPAMTAVIQKLLESRE